MSRDPGQQAPSPDDKVVSIQCAGLYPDEIDELKRLLHRSRYAFNVREVTTNQSFAAVGISFLQIDTRLSVGFSRKLLRSKRGAVDAIVKAIDETLSESGHLENREPRVAHGHDDEIVVTIHESTRPRSKKAPWSRTEKLAAGAVVFTAIGIGLTFFVPEVRQFLHLEKKPKPIEAQTMPVKSEHAQVIPNPEPSKAEPSEFNKPRNTQRATSRVKGDDNVAANNITGNRNVIGQGNPTGPSAVAPNGIVIAGGNVQNPTVNNFGPSQRRLSSDQQNRLASCLQKAEASSVFVAFAQHNFEAQTYSDDFVSALKAGGWTTKVYPVPYSETRIGSGVQVQVSVQVSDPKSVPPAADILFGCLTDVHLKIFATKSGILPMGEVMLYVGVPEASQ
jgi:hypothetical protein